MSKLNNKKGFTLIELLVVIAIIGILSSIVLASLNTARAKGSDAAIKSSLDQVRAQSELYYDANGSTYGALALANGGTVATACGYSGLGGSALASSSAIIAYATSSSGTYSVALNYIECFADSSHWVVSVPLKSNSTLSWCVDNTGASKQETASTSQAADGTCL